MVSFPSSHHALHEAHGFGRDGKVGETGGKARHAQDADRVFGKSAGDVAQYLMLQVMQPVVGVVQFATGGFGNGVDGQVSSRKVFFERNVGGGMYGKSGIAARGFALGACQCVFLFAQRMQKNWKVLADRQEPLRQHLLRRCSYHYPVVVLNRQAQPFVTHGTPDAVYMGAWDVVDGVVRHAGNQSVRGWMGADNGGQLGNDIRLYAENFNADRFTVGVSIRFFGGYTDGADLGMLQQCMGYVVAQGFLQINMATCGACGDGAADQVVIDDFMKAVLSRAGVAQQNIQVHIEPDTLWGVPFGIVRTNADMRVVIAQKQTAAMQDERVAPVGGWHSGSWQKRERQLYMC